MTILRTTRCPGLPMSLTDFEDCYQIMCEALRSCANLEFKALSCATSCVLNSTRPLQGAELQTAVQLYVSHRLVQARECSMPNQALEDYRVSTTRPHLWYKPSLFSLDEQGQIQFTSQAMPAFLQSFRIRGIDTSHRTIAVICLAQIECESGINNLRARETPYPVAFTTYARENWEHHVQMAEKKSLMFSDPTLRSQVLGSCFFETSTSLSDLFSTFCLNRDDDEDWVLVGGE